MPKRKQDTTSDTNKKKVKTTCNKSDEEDDEKERYWLIKAEPHTRMENGVDVKFSIHDLEKKKVEHWDGVRNYEARNILRDKMKVGDLCLFYHSNCKEPGIAGLAKVVKEGYPDFTAWDPRSPYFDPKSDKDKPKWFMVDVEFVKVLPRFISLKEVQFYKDEDALKGMKLLTRGRLSVQPVKKSAFEFILNLSEKDNETF
ncbi:Thymocyte nuclear protein 1 [Lobulomyces angularis]|nr:Thymocyte nuclear protein 1 [Lobulomyces angularis]